MNQNASFLAITESAFQESPKAIQEFLRTYFEEKVVLGIRCWVAFKTLSLSQRGNRKGVAPSHSVDVSGFGDHVDEGGLEGKSLYDVLKALQEQPDKCFSFYQSWDDGCSGPPICD